MDIAQYIADLLKENEEVGVPGIGTFYIKRQPASFDKNSNSFIPPKKVLGFKPGESDPSLLINHIAGAKNISPASAAYFAETFGTALQTRISESGQAEVHPVGKLSRQADQWAFHPSDNYDFSDYFGLSPVSEIASGLGEQFGMRPTASRQRNDEEKTDKLPEAIPEQAPADDFHETEAPVKRKTGMIAAGIILAVLLCSGVGIYLLRPDLLQFLQLPQAQAPATKQLPASDEETLTRQEAKADSILQQLEEHGFKDVEKIPGDTTVSKVDVTAQADTNSAYSPLRIEIIGASLPNRQDAENYIRQMKKRGIDARIVEEKKGRLIKVSLGSFTDKEKADAELQRIKREITQEAWPLTIKNQNKH